MRIKFLKAKQGDSIIVSTRGKNILIDGGEADCYYDSNLNEYGDLNTEIEEIRKRGELIDLIVLTHIDNDHICGLIKWFEMDEKSSDLISSIWFNSGREIAKILGEGINNDLKVRITASKSTKTGVIEAEEFEDYVVSKRKWDKKVWTSGMTFNHTDFKIEVISPEERQLRKLVREYKTKLGERAFTAKKSLDWHLDLKDLINEESKPGFKFQEDKSVKNGSSIAFILSAEGKRILFLGDAHPTAVLNGLAFHGYNADKPLEVEFVKLSHHGSNSNTNDLLLKAIKTDNFFISTNSEYHGHPGKRTIARILTSNPKANVYFNYEEVGSQVFTKQDKIDYQISAIVKNEFYL